MKVLLIDDSRLARQELRNLLKGYPSIEILEEAANAEEAKKQIESLMPDAVFLDIEMPGKNAFELIEELEYLPRIIFTTAYNEYAIQSFEYNALDYLLKPIQEKRFDAAIQKLMAQQEIVKKEKPEMLGENDQVFIRENEKCWFVKLQEIRLMKNEGNYSKVYFQEHQAMIPRSLQYLEQRLDAKIFFRANRQYIFNLRYIDKIDTWFSGNLKVVLKTGEEVEISRRQALKFKELLSL